MSTWGGSAENLCRLIEQIAITRRLGTHGFTIFEYQAGDAQDTVPLCRKGVTKRR